MALLHFERFLSGGTMLKLSEAIELGALLERPGSSLSFKTCAIGLGMAAVGVPREERRAKKAKELWPWLGKEARKSFLGLTKIDYVREISDWYFNVRLGRMTMLALLNRIRRIEQSTPEGHPTGSPSPSEMSRLSIS
jgi:hypothetical protein